METFWQEDTIRNAKVVSGTVSKLLEAMATQFHSQMSSNKDMKYKVTVFDLHTVPDIQLWDYIFRIMLKSKCCYRDLIVALVYIDKLINTEVISGISFHNIHKLLALSIMASTKFYDDVHFPNVYWSKFVGIPLRELNNAEIIFLQSLKFELNINYEIMLTWSESIARFADENPVQMDDSEVQQLERENQINSVSTQGINGPTDPVIIL